MKPSLALITLSILFSTTAFARIVASNNTFFVESKGNRRPITMLNTLAQNKEISAVKLFGDGRVNLVAFAKKNESEKLYSVDENGYIYSIRPFTNYNVKNVTPEGMVTFKEDTKRYRINSKGFFLY